MSDFSLFATIQGSALLVLLSMISDLASAQMQGTQPNTNNMNQNGLNPAVPLNVQSMPQNPCGQALMATDAELVACMRASVGPTELKAYVDIPSQMKMTFNFGLVPPTIQQPLARCFCTSNMWTLAQSQIAICSKIMTPLPVSPAMTNSAFSQQCSLLGMKFDSSKGPIISTATSSTSTTATSTTTTRRNGEIERTSFKQYYVLAIISLLSLLN